MTLGFRFIVSSDGPYLQLFMDEEGTKKNTACAFERGGPVLVSLVCGNRKQERKLHGIIIPPPSEELPREY